MKKIKIDETIYKVSDKIYKEIVKKSYELTHTDFVRYVNENTIDYKRLFKIDFEIVT